MPCLLLFAALFSGVDHLEYICVMTRKVCLKVLGYSVHAIWTPKSAKKVITESSSESHRSYYGRELSSTLPPQPNLHKYFWWANLVMSRNNRQAILHLSVVNSKKGPDLSEPKSAAKQLRLEN